MAERCIFCGGTPTTVEHVFSSKWILELMPKSKSFTTHFTRKDHDVETLARSWTTKVRKKSQAGSITVNCACAPCNNGWMQDVDNDLREALTALACGQEIGHLSAEGCRLLAFWSAKIASLIDEMWDEPLLDPQAKRDLRKLKQPPAGWYFWIGNMAEAAEETHLRATSLHPSPDSPDVEAVAFTFRVLFMLVQVVVPLKPGIGIGRTARSNPYVRQFWPHGVGFDWPPPEECWIPGPEIQEELEQSFRAKRKPDHGLSRP